MDKFELGQQADLELSATREAYKRLRASYLERLTATGPGQTAEREHYYSLVRALDDLADQVQEFINVMAFDAAASKLEQE